MFTLLCLRTSVIRGPTTDSDAGGSDYTYTEEVRRKADRQARQNGSGRPRSMDAYMNGRMDRRLVRTGHLAPRMRCLRDPEVAVKTAGW